MYTYKELQIKLVESDNEYKMVLWSLLRYHELLYYTCMYRTIIVELRVDCVGVF